MKRVIHLEKQQQWIEDEKVVLKAAQTVWATNKYFILACSQQDYRRIREYLKPHYLELNTAFKLMKQLHNEYQTLSTVDLPQISNALFHMAGYFKKHISMENRQWMHGLIKKDTTKALCQMEKFTDVYQMNYLKRSNIWPDRRNLPFNQVDTTIKHHGITYNPNELFWQGNHLVEGYPYANT